MRRSEWPAWVATVLVAILALRLCYLTIAYFLGSGGVLRYQIESGAMAWALTGLALRIFQDRPTSTGANETTLHERSGSAVAAIACIAASLFLYLPALHIGFLSDDYGLVQRAQSFELTAFNSEAFRPLPLLLWGVLLSAGAGAAAIHAINVIVHGLNSYLTARVADAYVPRPWSWVSAVVMLSMPIAPEAVAWCSGVFDVFATSSILISVLLARSYSEKTPVLTRVAFLATVIAGVLSKEIGVVAPVVVLVDALTRRRLPRVLATDATLLTVAATVYGAARWMHASSTLRQPISRYLLQRSLFGTFSSLASPWHIEASRVLPIATSLAAIALVTLFFLRRHPSADRTGRSLAAMGLVLIPVLPAATFLTVAPNLEGARLLYASSAGWAILLAAVSAPEISTPTIGTRVTAPLIAATIVMAIVGVRLHLDHWQMAATTRNQVEAAALADSRLAQCDVVGLSELPDNISGAYVFRNSVAEAFERDLNRRATVGAGRENCSFTWHDGRFEPTIR